MQGMGAKQMGEGRKAEKRLLEARVALEGLRAERDFLRAQVTWLQAQLQSATERAERSEGRLHEVTLKMVELSHEAITAPTRSGATEVLMDGKSILRLSNPISAQR
jgi:chromosome segregation ATPase